MTEKEKTAQHKLDLLNAVKEHRELLGNSCSIVDTKTVGKALQIVFKDLGKCKVAVSGEIAFINVAEDRGLPFLSPQIGGNIFKNIPEENIPELLRVCNHINLSLSMGFFGIMENSIYYKCNLMIRDFYPEDMQVQMLSDALLVFEEVLNCVVDSFVLVGRGLTKLEDEIESGRLK